MHLRSCLLANMQQCTTTPMSKTFPGMPSLQAAAASEGTQDLFKGMAGLCTEAVRIVMPWTMDADNKVRMVRQKDLTTEVEQAKFNQLKDVAGSWALMVTLVNLEFDSYAAFMEEHPKRVDAFLAGLKDRLHKYACNHVPAM